MYSILVSDTTELSCLLYSFSLHYTDALSIVKCDCLDERPVKLCFKVLSNIKNPDSHHLPPPTRQERSSVNIRNSSSLSFGKYCNDKYKKASFLRLLMCNLVRTLKLIILKLILY